MDLKYCSCHINRVFLSWQNNGFFWQQFLLLALSLMHQVRKCFNFAVCYIPVLLVAFRPLNNSVLLQKRSLNISETFVDGASLSMLELYYLSPFKCVLSSFPLMEKQYWDDFFLTMYFKSHNPGELCFSITTTIHSEFHLLVSWSVWKMKRTCILQ